MGDVTAVNMDTVTEKSGHQVTGMAVSVCITPAAPAPLPIPYPTMGTVGEGIVDGTLRTKINGSVHATVGSCVKVCHGNEAGTLKEVVSLNTAGPSFLTLGAPTVLVELGMAGITGSLVQMNKAITVGAGGSASDAGGDASGGGGGGGGGGAGDPNGPNGPSGGGGGGGGSHDGAAPPSPPAATGNEGKASGGHPVDVITGTMFTTPSIDVELFGPLPMQWVRGYRTSASARNAGIGWGWSHSFAWSARLDRDGITVFDDEGTPMRFPPVDEGQIAHAPFGRSLERRKGEIVLATRDGWRRVFRPSEKAGQALHLAEVRDPSDNVTDVEWDERGVCAVTDCLGRRLQCERVHQADVWKLVLTGAGGEVHRLDAMTYEYDARGDLVRATDRGGVSTEYEYDESHFVVGERQPDGVVYRFRYEDGADGKRRCVETWGEIPGRDVLAELYGEARPGADARGVFHTRFVYGPGPRESTMLDAEGGTWRYVGNTLGLVERYTDPAGNTTSMRYDARGHVLGIGGPTGESERRTVDRMGRLTSFTDATGRTMTFQRDARGDVVKMTDGAGLVWRTKRDDKGRVVERTAPGGGKTSSAYDERGRLTAISGPSGTRTIAYDAHGNPMAVTDVRGATHEYTFDLLGQPVRLRSPKGAVYELAYDSRGLCVSWSGPDGLSSQRQFDIARKLVAIRHPNGAVTKYRHVAGCLVEQQLADGSTYRFGYDALLRERWVENAAGERMLTDYDAAGDIGRERTFAGLETAFERDAARRVVRTVRPDGHVVRSRYDALGRLIEVEHDGGVATRFERDSRGNVTRAIAGGVTVAMAYDDLGNKRRETQSAGGWEFTVDYEYDARGDVARRRYSTGWGVALARGPGGRVEGLSVLDGRSAILEAVEIEHDANGRETRRARAGQKDGIVTERDVLSRPVAVSVVGPGGEIVRSRAYEWESQPALSRITDSDRGLRRFTNDVFGRPLAVSGLGVDEAFSYAPQGTPIAAKGATQVGAAGRVRATADANWDWDPAGRLRARRGPTPADSWTFAYDEEDRLIEATRGDGARVRYLYDPFGRRIASFTSDGASTWFGWDGGAGVEERSTGGYVERRVFADDGFTPLVDGVEVEGRSSWRLPATDAAGTPWFFLARDGSNAELDLSSWGRTVHRRGNPGRLRLAGQREDPETGLAYQKCRYYAPELGLFTTPDPLGVPDMLFDIGFVPNTSAYADPLGLTIICADPNDAECRNAAMARSQATGRPVVWGPENLTPGSLAGQPEVDVITHGNIMGGGKPIWGSGNRASGQQIGGALAGAGLENGAQVNMVSCGAGTRPDGKKQSVVEAVSQGAAQAGKNVTVSGAGGTNGPPSKETAQAAFDAARAGNGEPIRALPGFVVVGSDGGVHGSSGTSMVSSTGGATQVPTQNPPMQTHDPGVPAGTEGPPPNAGA